jgi:hypothetical protein
MGRRDSGTDVTDGDALSRVHSYRCNDISDR